MMRVWSAGVSKVFPGIGLAVGMSIVSVGLCHRDAGFRSRQVISTC
jgi:hypothetical protein